MIETTYPNHDYALEQRFQSYDQQQSFWIMLWLEDKDQYLSEVSYNSFNHAFEMLKEFNVKNTADISVINKKKEQKDEKGQD